MRTFSCKVMRLEDNWQKATSGLRYKDKRSFQARLFSSVGLFSHIFHGNYSNLEISF